MYVGYHQPASKKAFWIACYHSRGFTVAMLALQPGFSGHNRAVVQFLAL
jgi:hypothetical protein